MAQTPIPEIKASNEPFDERLHAAAKNQSIICGGGWKIPPKEYHLKIKAIGGALLTVASIAGGIYFYEAFGVYGFLPAVVLFICSILLIRFERPISFFGPPDGDHDIRNLYAQARGGGKQKSKQEPDDDTVG